MTDDVSISYLSIPQTNHQGKKINSQSTKMNIEQHISYSFYTMFLPLYQETSHKKSKGVSHLVDNVYGLQKLGHCYKKFLYFLSIKVENDSSKIPKDGTSI